MQVVTAENVAEVFVVVVVDFVVVLLVVTVVVFFAVVVLNFTVEPELVVAGGKLQDS